MNKSGLIIWMDVLFDFTKFVKLTGENINGLDFGQIIDLAKDKGYFREFIECCEG